MQRSFELRTPPEPGSNTATTVRVVVKCAALHADRLLVLPRGSNVGDLKAHIEQSWPGAPSAQGMRVIRAGRLLSDTQPIAPTGEEAEVSLHLAIRPDAWGVPSERPTALRRSSFHPTPPPHDHQDMDTEEDHSLAHLVRATAPRNLPVLLDVLEQAHSKYLARYAAWYRAETVKMDPALQELEKALGWNAVPEDGQGRDEYHQVTHHGLPFLLRVTTPVQMQVLLKRLEALRAAVAMVESLIALQPPTPAAPEQVQVQQQAPRAQPVDYAPLLWLAFKVLLMAYVFTRGASDRKRLALYSLAALYLLYEALAHLHRRPRIHIAAAPVTHALNNIANVGLDGQGSWVYVNVCVPVLLFFATMVPEVEGIRRRALEQRRT